MYIIQKLGIPDLFITFTCNPEWPEIRNQLQPNQPPTERPDLCCKVFKAKLGEFLELIDKGIFGKKRYLLGVIEFQKRGYPHAHLLLGLEEKYKPGFDPVLIDQLISCDSEP